MNFKKALYSISRFTLLDEVFSLACAAIAIFGVIVIANKIDNGAVMAITLGISDQPLSQRPWINWCPGVPTLREGTLGTSLSKGCKSFMTRNKIMDLKGRCRAWDGIWRLF